MEKSSGQASRAVRSFATEAGKLTARAYNHALGRTEGGLARVEWEVGQQEANGSAIKLLISVLGGIDFGMAATAMLGKYRRRRRRQVGLRGGVLAWRKWHGGCCC